MIVNYAKNFIKEYDVNSIDINTLGMVISKLGYNLVVYNPLFSYDDNIAVIIEGFNIDNELKNTCCFTCKSELANCIFVRDGIEEKELIHLLLHEICHIYMHHIDKNAIANAAYYEYEANKFADDVKHYVSQNRIKRKALYAVPAFLLSAVAVTAIIVLCIKQNKPDEFKYYQEIQETTTAITEIVTEPTTEAVTDTQPEPTTEVTEATTESTTETTTEEIAEENDETLYYVSASGTKYHLKTCYQINPERCSALPLDKILEMGYSPCKTCEPDKRS